MLGAGTTLTSARHQVSTGRENEKIETSQNIASKYTLYFAPPLPEA